MTTFKKWPSIENSYRTKYISEHFESYPELANISYVATEKLHGANFQWFIQPNVPLHAGSRNHYLAIDERFQKASIPDMMEKYARVLTSIQERADITGDTYRLFGELIGPGVAKGVDYGTERQIVYFGLMINDMLQSFSFLRQLMSDILGDQSDALLVPILEIGAWDDVINMDIEINSDYTDSTRHNAGENICEGIVIQPYEQVYLDWNNCPFILKMKNEAFKEKQAAKKPRVIDSAVEALNQQFQLYITDARLQSVFSKEGQIEEMNQIGNYIKLVLEDAKADFLKDHQDAFDALSKAQQKQALNVGSMIANMLKEYM